MADDGPRMRFDLKLISSWIKPGSTVLGLGCGNGDLMVHLKEEKQVKASGIEIKESRVAACIDQGLSVIQGDINEEVRDYPDNAFDYAVLSQTLQQVYAPDDLIRSMLRIARKGIVSFPNFSHWRVRMQLLGTGHVPKTGELPYEWYNTPNIRVLSLKDFQGFARKVGFEILKEAAVRTCENGTRGRLVNFMPNLFATYGIFMIGQKTQKQEK
ncbi:S-adenosylmethionine-dependent (SAM) methyltransferase [Desulforapulum autotrophicum HRM2]|jgi:methionine biosynthesis protein MetW|uniref:S-adenosylmethionine-dependent (SAM) methyltransferase n=1 Tax=Desulforapulum autotrophicum (strain ATCC 43914 / DSM 3382 / VKM B-1955 / HRM2) TaxID=177437 RepID=C0QGC8_DESAH|nr:methionine biosynthesis protein MetW [Desulforapulum autotrophicum]ACN17707.1 S-adenosylmethionine-dependent (SAM) methyltransferase [Desulforapulum autotrophicum HRM2]